MVIAKIEICMRTDYKALKMWVQIRDIMGTGQSVGTGQAPGIDLSSSYINQYRHKPTMSFIEHESNI